MSEVLGTEDELKLGCSFLQGAEHSHKLAPVGDEFKMYHILLIDK